MGNWFNKQWFTDSSDEKRIKYAANLEDCCEHVQEHPEMLYVITRENDSFGVVGEYGECQSCHAASQDAIDSEEVVCHDCGKTVCRSHTISWKWYDFYAPQGDEPMIICKDCRELPRHRNRVKQDRLEYEAEMFGDDSDDDDDYDY